MTKALKKINPGWIVLRVAELAIATVLLFLLATGLEQHEAARFGRIPASDWFEVVEIFVPDHEAGSNPLVVYDRQIKENFRGFWVAEVQRRDGLNDTDRYFAACSGSGMNDYERTDWLDSEQVTWEWFLGRPCAVRPGTYRIVVTYAMRSPLYPDHVKRYRVLSNAFRVYAPGTQPLE